MDPQRLRIRQIKRLSIATGLQDHDLGQNHATTFLGRCSLRRDRCVQYLVKARPLGAPVFFLITRLFLNGTGTNCLLSYHRVIAI